DIQLFVDDRGHLFTRSNSWDDKWSTWRKVWNDGNSNSALTDWSAKNLSVSGAAELKGSLTTKEYVFTQGTFQESDIRSKEDICGMHQVLDKVMQMNPIQYRYKADQKGKRKHLGFGAQEVKELFPELVHYSEDKDLYSLNYGNLGAINTAAIQETNICLHQGLHKHQEAIDEQKRIITEQKRAQKRLEKQLQSQKKVSRLQKERIQNQQASLEEQKNLLDQQEEKILLQQKKIQVQQSGLQQQKRNNAKYSERVEWLQSSMVEHKKRFEEQQKNNAALKEMLQLQEVKMTQQSEEMQEVKKLLTELSAPIMEKMGKKWRSLFGE
ncbi:tail fiber domain-containing protein, partial [Xanthovirga aplysinae]|uniref:tail fiber domain-containing protein n=1 Tax=Xanthovirga aplysinae TaxID=2529853 RepID=UPI0012BBFCF0